MRIDQVIKTCTSLSAAAAEVWEQILNALPAMISAHGDMNCRKSTNRNSVLVIDNELRLQISDMNSCYKTCKAKAM